MSNSDIVKSAYKVNDGVIRVGEVSMVAWMGDDMAPMFVKQCRTEYVCEDGRWVYRFIIEGESVEVAPKELH